MALLQGNSRGIEGRCGQMGRGSGEPRVCGAVPTTGAGVGVVPSLSGVGLPSWRAGADMRGECRWEGGAQAWT